MDKIHECEYCEDGECAMCNEPENSSEKIYYFTAKGKKRTSLLVAAMPYLDPFFDEFKRINKKQHEQQSGNQALYDAELEHTKAQAKAILPVNKGNAKVQEAAIDAYMAWHKEKRNAEVTQADAGLDLIAEVIKKVVTEYYNNAVQIVAILAKKEIDEIEEEYDIFDIADILLSVYEEPKVQRLFTRVRSVMPETR